MRNFMRNFIRKLFGIKPGLIAAEPYRYTVTIVGEPGPRYFTSWVEAQLFTTSLVGQGYNVLG